MDNIEGVKVADLNIIHNEKGDIFHALKKSDKSFVSFGEAYFSNINKGEIKGWKKHTEMILNLIVPVGLIRIYLIDYRENSNTYGFKNIFEIGLKNYKRITIPPNIWFAFEGLDNQANLLLNIASIEHSPLESINKELNEFDLFT